jgi:predicted GIY-YIG superfamily endonuclease
MHYMVYVLCNASRTFFYLGVTGGFTDAIFEEEVVPPPAISIWNQFTRLVHHRQFRTLEEAARYLDRLQSEINQWDFSRIERQNKRWADLTSQWMKPTRLLSFLVMRNSIQCAEN